MDEQDRAELDTCGDCEHFTGTECNIDRTEQREDSASCDEFEPILNSNKLKGNNDGR